MTFKKVLLSLTVIIVAGLFSCKKTDSVNNSPDLPDLVSKIQASASGFVVDENDNPVVAATVRMGSGTTTTDQFGYFKFENVEVVKTAAVITVTHSGYFKGIRTFAGREYGEVFVRIKLSPKTVIGTIDASAGGNVATPQGLGIALPANSVVDESTGAAYSGIITVLAKWLDPTSTDIGETMPGDLRALNEAGEMKLLITYGMAGIELIGDAGQQLQIATGKTSTLTFPIPASISASAPASIPLWHFDEEKGLWIEEGSAVKTGNVYVGEVTHFTFWNVDVPQNFVRIEGRVVADNGSPLSFVRLKISEMNTPANFRFGLTDAAGSFDGFVPVNSALKLEVVDISSECQLTVLTQTFQTTDAAINLGVITVSVANTPFAEISGTIVDCSDNPLQGTSIFYRSGSSYRLFNTDSSGNFNFTVLLCEPGTSTEFQILDQSGFPSPAQTFNLNAGSYSLGIIRVCNTVSAEFFSYSIDGIPETYTAPSTTMVQSVASGNLIVQAINAQSEGRLAFMHTGIGLNSDQEIISFMPVDQPPLITTSNTSVRITEYGPVGGYIAGHFTGNFFSQFAPVGIIYIVQASFRVRRMQ